MQLHSSNLCFPNSSAYDSKGNIYVTGRFYDNITIEDTTLLTFNQDTGGIQNHSDMYLAKLDSTGHLIWALKGGVIGTQIVTGAQGAELCVDKWDNIYVAVIMWNDMIINGDTLTRTTYGYCDMLLLKYNPDGELIWHRKSTGYGSFAGSVCCDNEGNILISGSNQGINIYEGDSLVPRQYYYTFFAKYSTNGDLLWLTKIDEGGVKVVQIRADNSGNIYTTGVYVGQVWFGDEFYFDDAVDRRIFVAKMNPSGKFVWARTETSPASDNVGLSVAVWENYLYTCGRLDPASPAYGGNDVDTTISSFRDLAYVAKYDTSGQLIWFKITSWAKWLSVYKLTVSSSGIIAAIIGGLGIIYFPDTTYEFNPGQNLWYELDSLGNFISINYYKMGFSSISDMSFWKNKLLITAASTDTVFLPIDTLISSSPNDANGFLYQIKDNKYYATDDTEIIPITNDVIIFPNPTTETISIKYFLSKSSDIIIELLDPTGRKLQSIKQGNKPAGEYVFQMNFNGLCSGMYLVNLKTGNNHNVHKVFKY
ncbi:MAG: T9SS type A sorting domain-containing protein [Bacteroidetes bacterium]|nr:T9SS type A sorting domain-containing protein [Bacteroidota bacterium]